MPNGNNAKIRKIICSQLWKGFSVNVVLGERLSVTL